MCCAVLICLKIITLEGLFLAHNLCFCFASRGDSVSASHCGHSTRTSSDTGTVTWHYSDPELPGWFHKLHRVEMHLRGFGSFDLNFDTLAERALCTHRVINCKWCRHCCGSYRSCNVSQGPPCHNSSSEFLPVNCLPLLMPEEYRYIK